ncbi:MAG: EAL domain-containing protein, partial [Dehalococcoidia bacterium]|nr:EAL domain-containing protein [Dehalococcoidia bacterium]
EALVRWRNHGEYVSPTHFIPLAEQAGMIPDITRAVLHAVVTQLDAWRGVGISVPVSVNISVLDLDDDRFTDALAELLQESSVPAHLLELEITETALLRDVETARAAAGRLEAMGVSLSIDDFGVGFAPLTYLTTFPLHAIKLDRAFVADLVSNPRSETIVASTIGLAHGLGLEVIAEGVETTEVAAVLRRLGCDHVQGYAFARPGPAGELAEYATGPVPASWRPPVETR